MADTEGYVFSSMEHPKLFEYPKTPESVTRTFYAAAIPIRPTAALENLSILSIDL